MRAPVPEAPSPAQYWDLRARDYAAAGEGLAAVCSYGMPDFYNRAIHRSQELALAPYLERARPGQKVLDVGCGVGRWSRTLAARGVHVTGIDLSPRMIAEASRRAKAQGVAHRCRFLVQDLARLAAGEQYDMILCVTVLQHITDARALRAAAQRLAQHLVVGGTLVLLEAAPVHANTRCNSETFLARTRSDYIRLFHGEGMHLRELSGVDPAPFRRWLLPRLSRMPPQARTAALALATGLSVAIDGPFGRWAVDRSWHMVFDFQRTWSAK